MDEQNNNLPSQYQDTLANTGSSHTNNLITQEPDPLKFAVPKKIEALYDQLEFGSTSPIKNVTDFAIQLATDANFADTINGLLDTGKSNEDFLYETSQELFGPSLLFDNKIAEEDRDTFMKNFAQNQGQAYQPTDITARRFKEIQPYLLHNENQIVQNPKDSSEYFFIYKSDDPEKSPSIKIVNDLREDNTVFDKIKANRGSALEPGRKTCFC